MLRTSPHLNTGAVLERWREREEGRYLAKLVQQENLIDSDQEEVFSSLLQQLYRRHVIQRKDILCNTQELTQREKEELQQLYKYLNENPATRGGAK